MRVVEPRLHVYEAELRKMLMPRKSAPQARAGGAAGALAPCRVAVLLEQRTAGVPHSNNAAQVVGGQQHCIVLAAKCFYGCNKAVGALYIGEVGGLAVGYFALEAGGVVAGGGGGVPSPFLWVGAAAI